MQDQINPEPEVDYSYPSRSCSILLIFYILFAQIVNTALIVLFNFVYVNLHSILSVPLETVYFWGIILLQLSNVSLIILIFLHWAHTIYLIKPNQIVEQHGIWEIKESIYSTDPIVEVIVHQSWLGRIFNYGTLEISNPLLKTNFQLINIHSPYFYAKVIQSSRRSQNIRLFPQVNLMESFDSTTEI